MLISAKPESRIMLFKSAYSFLCITATTIVQHVSTGNTSKYPTIAMVLVLAAPMIFQGDFVKAEELPMMTNQHGFFRGGSNSGGRPEGDKDETFPVAGEQSFAGPSDDHNVEGHGERGPLPFGDINMTHVNLTCPTESSQPLCPSVPALPSPRGFRPPPHHDNNNSSTMDDEFQAPEMVTGVWVCRQEHHGFGGAPHGMSGAGDNTSVSDATLSPTGNFSTCVAPNMGLDSDVCGCCDGYCPELCTCPCDMFTTGDQLGVLITVTGTHHERDDGPMGVVHWMGNNETQQDQIGMSANITTEEICVFPFEALHMTSHHHRPAGGMMNATCKTDCTITRF